MASPGLLYIEIDPKYPAGVDVIPLGGYADIAALTEPVTTWKATE